MIIGAAKPQTQRRISSDSVWPLRRADGRTWAEASKEQSNDRRRKPSGIMEAGD